MAGQARRAGDFWLNGVVWWRQAPTPKKAPLTNLTASSLDVRSGQDEIQVHMAEFRTIVTALIVCALAVLPATSASAAMRMAATMGSPASVEHDGGEPASMHGDCENHVAMASVETDAASAPTADDRGRCPDSGCSKCLCLGLAVTGVLSIGPTTPSFAFAAIPTGWATPSLQAPAIRLPSPPPRV